MKSLTIYIDGPVEVKLGLIETLRLTFYVGRYHARYGRLSRHDIRDLVIKEALRRRGIKQYAY